jgi:hypothetical protein
MPPVSQAQRRLMHAAAKGKSKKVSKKVGQEFIKDDHKKGLPERKKKKGKR